MSFQCSLIFLTYLGASLTFAESPSRTHSSQVPSSTRIHHIALAAGISQRAPMYFVSQPTIVMIPRPRLPPRYRRLPPAQTAYDTSLIAPRISVTSPKTLVALSPTRLSVHQSKTPATIQLSVYQTKPDNAPANLAPSTSTHFDAHLSLPFQNLYVGVRCQATPRPLPNPTPLTPLIRFYNRL